jgi:uridylate kinase
VFFLKPKYKRILLKVSGEALAGSKKTGFDNDILDNIASVVKKCVDVGVQVGIVVGGGNFWRGRSSENMDRAIADNVGMLATAMNGLVLSDSLKRHGLECRVQSAFPMEKVAEYYTKEKAVSHLEEGKVVIFVGGSGNPFFSTDTASAIRGIEIEADIFFKATMVDGVYDKDPNKYSDAVKFKELTFSEVIEKQLAVMDITAVTLCREQHLPILVFDMSNPENIYNALFDDSIGTVVKE